MSLAASAENTMKFVKVQNNSECHDNNNNNMNNENKYEDNIFFKETHESDDDMVVIIVEEDSNSQIQNGEYENENQNVNLHMNEKSVNHEEEHVNDASETEEPIEKNENENSQIGEGEYISKEEKRVNVPPSKQKYVGIEVYTHLQHIMESKKMYPLLPCNMISSFAHVMEYVEYFDIPSEERRKLVVDLVQILAYSNNDYGSRDCFEYFVEHNMIDDIIKTIIDSTKSRYDVNRFPHTNRKIVLSCVSLSKKIKIVKPSAKIESLFEEFKLNLCGLKRFFKMKEKDESKQT